jgi:hypothetical protein
MQNSAKNDRKNEGGSMSKFPKVSHPIVYVSYLIFVFLCVWAGLHENGLTQMVIGLVSNGIPSISSLAATAPDPAKAEFEVAIAWWFSLVIPFFSFKKMDWVFIENRHKKMGGTLIAALVLIVCGLLVLLMLAVPITPTATRRGMLISVWFKHDVAYVWGCAIILVAGFAWSFIAMSGVILYRKFSKRGLFK